MDRGSLQRYWNKVYAEFQAAFAEKHTPHEIAASFAIGLFAVTLPSLGLGLLFFLLLTRYSDRISPIAIFSTGLVINPLVKAPMYIAALWIGSRLFGPVASAPSGSLAYSTAIALRMVSGLVVLGAVLAVIGYFLMYGIVREYRRRDIEIVEELLDDDLLSE